MCDHDLADIGRNTTQERTVLVHTLPFGQGQQGGSRGGGQGEVEQLMSFLPYLPSPYISLPLPPLSLV
jgi:hypothetical protein